jgi:NTF2 fold immunity protein of polymorphic toxin system component
MLMVVLLPLILLAASSAKSICDSASNPGRGPILTEGTAIAIAKPALVTKLGIESVAKAEPYHAELIDGNWHVFGTFNYPAGWRGGVPEATLCSSNGAVIDVWHGR